MTANPTPVRTIRTCLCLLTFALLTSIAFTASAADGKPKGIKIKPDMEDLLQTLDAGLVCLEDRNDSNKITPGKRKGKFFYSTKSVHQQVIKKLSAKKPIDFQTRRKIRQVKINQQKELLEQTTLCSFCPQVRNATTAYINATSTDAETKLYTLMNLIGTRLGEVADPTIIFARAEICMLDALQNKADFDAMFTAMEALQGFYDVENFVPTDALNEDPGTSEVECTVAHDVILYSVNGENTPFLSSMAGTLLLRELSSDDARSTNVQYRYWTNPSGMPATSGEEFCRIFRGPASQPFVEPDASTAIASLPQALKPVASAYQDAYNRCLTAYNISANAAQTASAWVTESASFAAANHAITSLRAAVGQDVTSGRQVIGLGHSRGNSLVKLAFDTLPTDDDGDQRGSAGVVSLASPYTFAGSGSYGGFKYFTQLNDIAALVSGAPSTNLQGTLSNVSGVTPTTHFDTVQSFYRSYLYDSTIRDSVIDGILDMSEALVNARAGAGQGYFQVTLTWDNPGDIDLHLYEPGGAHVFYADKQGDVGELDKDDIPGTGPENYFVCNRSQLVAGAYKVEVNNYANDTGTVSTIIVRAGSQVKTYNVIMGAANANHGNLPVATVTYGTNGLFTIQDDT